MVKSASKALAGLGQSCKMPKSAAQGSRARRVGVDLV